MATIGGSNIATDGLVLALDAANTKSYISGSSTWNDLSGNGNTGTLTNGPTFSSDNNGSIVFDGSNDYIDLGNGASINTTNNVSVNVWFKITSAPTTSFRGIIAKRNGAAGITTNYGINFNSNQFQSYYNTTGTFRALSVNYSSYFTTNTWYNVFTTLAQNSTNTDVKIYLNGLLIGSGTLTDNITTTAANATIGASYSTDEFFNGNIAIAQVYNRALSAAEIQQNYNGQKSRFNL
jgi:hypothetical protein